MSYFVYKRALLKKLFYIIYIFILSGCTTPQKTLDYGQSTFAKLSVVNSDGLDPACKNLVNISYSIKNGDFLAKDFRYSTWYVEDEIKMDFYQNHYSDFVDNIRNKIRETNPIDIEATLSIEESMEILLSKETKKYFSSENDEPNSKWEKKLKDKLNAEKKQIDIEVEKEINNRVELAKKQISNMQDVEYLFNSLKNNPNIKRSQSSESLIATNDNIKKHYVAQKSNNTCYAASLTNIWHYFGWPASYNDFLNKRMPNCNLPENSTASFIEIIQTAMNVRVGKPHYLINYKKFRRNGTYLNGDSYTQTLNYGGVTETSHSYWEINTPSTALKNLLPRLMNQSGLTPPSMPSFTTSMPSFTNSGVNLYKGFYWNYENNSSIQGQIRPLIHTGDLINTLLDRGVILLGLTNNNSGHTYLVTGAEFVPDIQYNRNHSISFTSGTKILKLRLLDPALKEEPENWHLDVDEIFKSFRFGIVFTDSTKSFYQGS